MSLLSGIERLGLGNLENLKIFEDRSKERKKNGQEDSDKKVMEEKDFLFEKSYDCPVCDKNFRAITFRTGKVKTIGTDPDLRPRYESIDLLKYDPICCPKCGFAALSRYFKTLSSIQIKLIKENITKDFQPGNYYHPDGICTYEEAVFRYKLCLANAIVKRAKGSEKAYICLKAGWVMRGLRENLDKGAPNYIEAQKQALADEDEFLKNALEGFMDARSKEAFPMCGMDEVTMDYLMAMLAIRFEQDDVAAKLISSIIVSRTANARIKDKARDVKDELLKRKREREKGKAKN